MALMTSLEPLYQCKWASVIRHRICGGAGRDCGSRIGAERAHPAK